MKLTFRSAVIVLAISGAQSVSASDTSHISATAKAKTPPSLQVIVTERDGREEVVSVQTTDIATVVSQTPELVSGALSGNPNDIKSITITHN